MVVGSSAGRSGALRRVSARLLAIADLPGDDDDTRLRKRMGVAAGYITILAPWGVVFASTNSVLGWTLASSLSAFSAANLVVLAWSRRFERYVTALLVIGPLFVVAANVLTGGVTNGGAGLVWGFLGPAYALLALGPARATRWQLVFIASVVAMVIADPVLRTVSDAPPYEVQLAFYLQNVVVPLTIVFLLLRYTDQRRRSAEARSNELLTNAIPQSIADRLRHGEERIAEAYPETTVVFTDVAGFTPWARHTDPARIVALLDDLFTRLDALAVSHGLEKIKTVGDAYMAVAGAPEPRSDHADAAAAFGLAVLDAVAAWRSDNDIDLHVRVGLASGPVVGGVIGRRRILFDLWGATVNEAARMESSGVPDRIQAAPSTRERLGSGFTADAREIEVKGLGPMTVYLLGSVSRIRAEERAASGSTRRAT